ncbi:hypothetical protein N665_0229s0060 [Sinapis alba]|nr:hypothetical protein N665_0229s0060 [Sinapis alba]
MAPRRLSGAERKEEELNLLRLAYEGVLFYGFISGCLLYTGCYPMTDPPHLVMPRRLVCLTMGLFFGQCTVGIAVLIYTLERKRSGRYLPKRKRKKKPRRSMGQSVFARFGIWKKMEDSRKGKDEDDEEEEDCPICLQHLNVGFGSIRLRNCMHKFHRRCIDKWLFKCAQCPICRSLACRNNYL